MRRICSLGLVLLVFLISCAFARDARASDSAPTATIGLGLTIGGAALTTVSAIVLLATSTCQPDARGEGCPPRVDQKAAAIGLVVGIVALGVGIPLYATADSSQKSATNRQLATAIDAVSFKIGF